MTTIEDQAASLRGSEEIRRDKARLLRGLRCISVASGKGGVGKTVVSIALGLELSRRGSRVLMLDADLGLANVDIQLGVEPALTVQDVIYGGKSFSEVVCKVRDGLDLLASSSGAPEMADMGNARRTMFVEDLLSFASGYDYLIIDIAAGIGQSITAFLKSSPEVLVVVANEPTSIMDAYSLLKVVGKSGSAPKIHIAVNMVRHIDDGERLYRRLDGIVRKFLGESYPCVGVIAFDHTVGDAIRARRPITEYAPGSAAALCLKELVTEVIESGSRGRKAGDICDLFERLAGTIGGEGGGM